MKIGKGRPMDKDRLLVIVDSEAKSYEYYVIEAKLRGKFSQPKKHKWITEDGMEFGTAEQAMAYLDKQAGDTPLE